jgi:pimeloyl-ACP methyl ester carboxylesterase
MTTQNTPATIAEVEHHTASVNGTTMHYASAGAKGSPILLVHGFPESWWTFHKVIPLLAKTHLAATHPDDVASFTGIELGLAGFGLESLGDITHGGSWHVGVLSAPGIAEMLFPGRERDLIGRWAFPSMTAVPGAISESDVDEFVLVYSRADGGRGSIGRYQSMLAEGDDLKALAASDPLTMPTLAVGGFGGPMTIETLSKVPHDEVASVRLDGIGHYVAMEAPNSSLTRSCLSLPRSTPGHRGIPEARGPALASVLTVGRLVLSSSERSLHEQHEFAADSASFADTVRFGDLGQREGLADRDEELPTRSHTSDVGQGIRRATGIAATETDARLLRAQEVGDRDHVLGACGQLDELRKYPIASYIQRHIDA